MKEHMYVVQVNITKKKLKPLLFEHIYPKLFFNP